MKTIAASILGFCLAGIIQVQFIMIPRLQAKVEAVCDELSRQPIYQHQPFPLDCENL